jgi:D-sedoheptulose 7-phosphate isomerase
VVLSGFDGGLALEKADYYIKATGERTSTIQEFHILLAHTICECVEREVFNF